MTDGTDDWDLLGSYENDSEYKETTGVSSAYGKNSVPYSKIRQIKHTNIFVNTQVNIYGSLAI